MNGASAGCRNTRVNGEAESGFGNTVSNARLVPGATVLNICIILIGSEHGFKQGVQLANEAWLV